MTEYHRAIELGSKEPLVYYNLGLEVLKKGEVKETITLFQKAIRLNPDYAKAHRELASIHANRGEVKRAIEGFQEVVRINPEDGTAHFRLAVLYDRLGVEQEARGHYELFLKKAQSQSVTVTMVVRAKKRLLEIRGRDPS